MELQGELFHAIILVIIITWDSMGNPFMQSVVFSDNNHMELHGELFHAISFVIMKKIRHIVFEIRQEHQQILRDPYYHQNPLQQPLNTYHYNWLLLLLLLPLERKELQMEE